MDLVRVKKKGSGWFAPTQEFIQHRGDHLTLVPVKKSNKYGWLRTLWLTHCPEFWQKYKRRKSHKEFVKRVITFDVTLDPVWFKDFGSDFHIAYEKQRIMSLPPVELSLLPFDCRRRSSFERNQFLRQQILEARISLDNHRKIVQK